MIDVIPPVLASERYFRFRGLSVWVGCWGCPTEGGENCRQKRMSMGLRVFEFGLIYINVQDHYVRHERLPKIFGV